MATTQEQLQKAAHDVTATVTGQADVLADWAADGLERVSSTLRNKDLDGMLRDVQSFARQQPVAFFAAAVAAGFLATRFLKAGTQDESSSQSFPSPGAGGVSATGKTDVSSSIPF